MSNARILFSQFRDEQSDSRYPFSDTATLASNGSTPAVTIAADTFVDASLFPIGSAGQLYLSSITVAPDVITVAIGDASRPGLIFSSYAPTAAPENGVLPFVDNYGRPAGMLLSSPLNLSRFSTWPAGTYQFAATATAFVAGVCVPANEPGVRGLLTANGTLLAGDVWLVGDAGVAVRQVSSGVVQVDVVGVPLFKRFVCEPLDDFPSRRYLKTINGCPGDQFNNFTLTATNHLVADTVLRICPQNGTIVIDTVGRSTT
jgi:hypothetical protein